MGRRISAILAADKLLRILAAGKNGASGPRAPADLAQGGRRILLIKLDHIGDTLLAFPAIRALRRAAPRACLTLLVGSACGELARRNPDVDGALVYDLRFLLPRARRGFGQRFTGLQLLRLGSRLRGAGFDVAIDLSSDTKWETLILTYLSGAPERVGDDALGCGGLLTRVVPFSRQVHVADLLVRKVQAAAPEAAAVPGPPTLALDRADRAAAGALLQRHQLGGARVVALHPGASDASKAWSVVGFASLADELVARYGVQVVFTGAAEDHELIERIRKAMQRPGVNLSGATGLLALAALYQRCRLVVAVDGGPMHLCAAVGTPLVALFKAEAELERWSPLTPACRVLRTDLTRLTTVALLEQAGAFIERALA
ncbi:MAG: glycosyltransferase family 9 protein [Deltaproteobacteria bacterium]|nr:glycosyltransferase family 9 protein [Deltaproteobacteria bacterium]